MPRRIPDKDVQRVVAAVTEVARPIIREWYAVDSCIASTRIAVDVLRRLGVRATPTPVKAAAFNPAAIELIKQKKEHLIPQGVNGAWSVAIGYSGRNEPGKWDGHLAAFTQPGFLVDLSADQMSRPEHDMVVTPMWAPVGPDFRKQGERRQFIDERTGVLIEYISAPELSPLWKESPAWARRDRWRPVSDEVLKAAQALLEEED